MTTMTIDWNDLTNILIEQGVEHEVRLPVLRFLNCKDYEAAVYDTWDANRKLDYDWRPVAQTNRLIIAVNPATAHNLLTAWVSHFKKSDLIYPSALLQGTIIGLLEMGIKLDQDTRPATAFQRELLGQLIRMVFESVFPRQAHREYRAEEGVPDFNAVLTKTLKRFLFPAGVAYSQLESYDPRREEGAIAHVRSQEVLSALRLAQSLNTPVQRELHGNSMVFMEAFMYALFSQQPTITKVLSLGEIVT